MIPGVARPWIISSAVMVENAAPSSTVRPSLARAPATVSPTEATAAMSAPVATSHEVHPRRGLDLFAAEHVQQGRDADGPCREQRQQPARSLPLLDH